MRWSEQAVGVSEALEQFLEENRHVLGPHQRTEEDDPTVDMPDGTWVLAGYVLIAEWHRFDEEHAHDREEYVRFFPSKRISDVQAVGLLHTALYDMD